jgi:hypothetical protein
MQTFPLSCHVEAQYCVGGEPPLAVSWQEKAGLPKEATFMMETDSGERQVMSGEYKKEQR